MTPGVDTMSAPWPAYVPHVVTERHWWEVPPFVALVDLVDRAARRCRARVTHPHKRQRGNA